MCLNSLLPVSAERELAPNVILSLTISFLLRAFDLCVCELI